VNLEEQLHLKMNIHKSKNIQYKKTEPRMISFFKDEQPSKQLYPMDVNEFENVI
jgi:hypothetical protein